MRASVLFNNQWDVWIRDAGQREDKPSSLHWPNKNHMFQQFWFSSRAAAEESNPSPWERTWKRARSKDMWLAIKLHMYYKAPPAPFEPLPPSFPKPRLPSPATALAADSHVEPQGAVETIVEEEATWANNRTCLASKKNKSVAGVWEVVVM